MGRLVAAAQGAVLDAMVFGGAVLIGVGAASEFGVGYGLMVAGGAVYAPGVLVHLGVGRPRR